MNNLPYIVVSALICSTSFYSNYLFLSREQTCNSHFRSLMNISLCGLMHKTYSKWSRESASLFARPDDGKTRTRATTM